MIGLEGRQLRSARLRYRLLEPGDVPALREILRSPEITEPAGFLPAKDDAAFAEFFRLLTQCDAAVAILLEDTLIGYIHVYPERVDSGAYAGRRCVGFGFVIGKPWHNQGYGTEALNTLTAYILSVQILLPDADGNPVPGPVDACFCDHFTGNDASRRVIEKAGYRYVEAYSMYFEELGREMICLSYARGKEAD